MRKRILKLFINLIFTFGWAIYLIDVCLNWIISEKDPKNFEVLFLIMGYLHITEQLNE